MTESTNTESENFAINMIGVPVELGTEVWEFLRSMIDQIGQSMDLKGLDGITFASNYQQALLDLDRGYDTDHKLIPSNDQGVGIAMSPRVLRNNVLKTHIVINAEMFFALLLDKRHDKAVNTVAHECAHVLLNDLYDAAFPETMLRMKANALDSFRTDCMLACWDEFGACWLSAAFGPSDVLAYEAAFLPALQDTRLAANTAIKEYRTHHDIGTVLNQVCGLYGRLLKYSAYHLGNLHGLGVDWRTLPTTADPLQDHWFLPFFERLDNACKAIADEIGDWECSVQFDALRDLAEDIVADGGMYFGRHDDDRISLHIPYSIETMP